jgi:hypothetical protein
MEKARTHRARDLAMQPTLHGVGSGRKMARHLRSRAPECPGPANAPAPTP